MGSCVDGVCVASVGDGGSSSGSSGSGSGGSSSGSTGGTHPGCLPWTSTPSPTYDAACNSGSATTEVCGPSGTCIPNCNDSAGYCGSEVCQVNGHCKTAGGGSTGTVIGGSSGSQGSAGVPGGSSSGARGSTFGSTGFGSTGFGGSGFGSSGFGASSGGFGGGCGQTGLASCSRSTELFDCCSGYCVSGVCACNKGGGQYPCVTQTDCCSGAICNLGICE